MDYLAMTERVLKSLDDLFLFLTRRHVFSCHFFFFNDTATTEIYTLSLHDALPILDRGTVGLVGDGDEFMGHGVEGSKDVEDRKSTRLNSSHQIISYAVFCLKKKKQMRLTKLQHTLRGIAHTSPEILLNALG